MSLMSKKNKKIIKNIFLPIFCFLDNKKSKSICDFALTLCCMFFKLDHRQINIISWRTAEKRSLQDFENINFV
jgi:hypothetical protein